MPPNTSTTSNLAYNDHSDVSDAIAIQQLIDTTPFVDVEIARDSLFKGAYKVVSAIFPNWKHEDLKFVQCKDGITNQLAMVTHVVTDFSVLVRAYGKGSELIIDRQQEIMNIVTLSSQNLCPPLYARFRNGLMYGFIKGRVSKVDDLGKLKYAAWIAKRVAEWHKVRLAQDESAPQQKLWSTMQNWLCQVPDTYNDPETQQTFVTHFNKKLLETELEKLIQKLEALDSPIVFSHNDLLYGNIIFDDEKEQASFIDYEYGCYAFRGFDIGNHFNEFAGFECDYTKYPTKEFQLQWFDWYLTTYNGVKPSSEEIDHLYLEVEGFSLASHFYWGLWALIQAKISDIDFDYMRYAVLRFDEYYRRKCQVYPEL